MKEQGFEVVMISSPGDDASMVEQQEGCEMITLPMERKVSLWADIQSLIRLKKILKKVPAYTNLTNEINIEKELIRSGVFLYMKPFGGVPLFVSVKNNHISFEHTHPPHEYIISHDKFIKVQQLKEKFEEILS